MDEHTRQEAEKWGHIIARAYSDMTSPPLSSAHERVIAHRLAEKLSPAMWLSVPSTSWDSYVNGVLDEWERSHGGQGRRLASVDLVAETVEMRTT